jgi:predicted phosphoribosyltransferase
MRFRDRKDAGQRLAAALARYKGQDCVVLALPRGGVPVAAEVAEALGAPLDLILVRKIGAPWHPELAVGAVVDGGTPTVVQLPEVMRMSGTSKKEFDEICLRERAEIERRRAHYLSGVVPLDPKGKIAILIDDGIATGATMHAALQATRRRGPKRLILAVPVASHEALEDLGTVADEVVCLETPESFRAVGLHYRNFDQTSDEEVISALTRLRARAPAAGAARA